MQKLRNLVSNLNAISHQTTMKISQTTKYQPINTPNDLCKYLFENTKKLTYLLIHLIAALWTHRH